MDPEPNAILAQALAELIDPSLVVEYHLAVAGGSTGVKFVHRSDDTYVVESDPNAPPYTDEQIAKSLTWLADREYGKPVTKLRLV